MRDIETTNQNIETNFLSVANVVSDSVDNEGPVPVPIGDFGNVVSRVAISYGNVPTPLEMYVSLIRKQFVSYELNKT